MFEEIIEKIAEISREEEKPVLKIQKSKKQVEKKRFKPIEKQKRKEKNTVVFIDGGNAEIIGNKEFTLQRIRGSAVKYRGKEHKKVSKKEGYLLVRTIREKSIKEEGVLYEISFYGEELKEEFKNIIIDPSDPELKIGDSRMAPQRCAELGREILETSMAERTPDEDFIVRDGSLEANTTHEAKIRRDLPEGVKNRSFGLAKTTQTTTTRGKNACTSLLQKADRREWLYQTELEINNKLMKGEVFFVKLNPHSEYVFRLDAPLEAEEEGVLELVETLKEHAKDPVFLGYPYGLIKADREARVPHREAVRLRTKLMSKAGKKRKDIERVLKTSNAHDILDSIRS